MSDDADFDVTGDLPAEIAALLARPDVWAALPDGLEDAVVAAIAAPPTTAATDELAAARARRVQRAAGWVLGAAAAVVVLVAGLVLVTRDDDESVAFASELDGTELAPDAWGSARFEATPAGLRIVLEVAGLAAAPDGEMYEAWISDGDIRVSCGSFHLRGGNEPIALWAGTADPAFRTMTVTREPIDGVTDSSGQVVLRGEFEMPDGEGG